MTRYDADQDDLLVNMEDVGRLDTNFRNPTYSQLTVYWHVDLKKKKKY